MHRLPIRAGFLLFLLAPSNERIEAVYREDATLAFEQTDSFSMDPSETSMTVNGMELPPEVLEEMGLALPSNEQETTLRWKDVVVTVEGGRPTRVRRTFEHLREHSVESGEEAEKTGPLEGKTVVLSEEQEGDLAAELEGGDPEGIEERYLEGHRLVTDADPLLPDHEVAVGDTWEVQDEALREFFGIESGPAFFERDQDEDRSFDEMLEENGTVTAEVEFESVEERDGLRCAVLTFRIEFEADVENPEFFGMAEQEGMELLSSAFSIQLRCEGKLWYALEGRPVAMQQALEGEAEFGFEARVDAEGQQFQMETHLAFTIEGEYSASWSSPE
jgi:hypothetical protein